MPYLHWELDRKQQKMATLAKDLTHEFRKRDYWSHVREKKQIRDFLGQFQTKLKLLDMHEAHDSTDLVVDRPKKPVIPDNPCGRYLLQAARVFEGMDLEPDMLLMRHHLHPNLYWRLPFHPRRTLDQSDYPRLEQMEMGNVDQVVYRGTTAYSGLHRHSRVIMVDQLWLYILDDSNKSFRFYSSWGHGLNNFRNYYHQFSPTCGP
jgi:hypothetical protein